MASAGRGAGPGGGLPVKDEISEADMDIMEPPAKEPERVGLKRVRDSANAKGFIGVTTAQKKPTLQPHDNVKFLKKAGSGNLVHPNVDGTSEMGGLYLHGTHGSQSLPDSNALRCTVWWCYQWCCCWLVDQFNAHHLSMELLLLRSTSWRPCAHLVIVCEGREEPRYCY